MRSRHLEWLIAFVTTGLLAWALTDDKLITQPTRPETPAPVQAQGPTVVGDQDMHEVVSAQDEYEILAAALDFLWDSNYGLTGDFIVLKEESAVPFPGKNEECPFYEPPPAKEPHQKRAESLERTLKNGHFQISSAPLKTQNQTRVLWDISKFKTKAKLRNTDSLDKTHSGEFYNQTEALLRKSKGRAFISLSRPGVAKDSALLYVIDHGKWPSYVLLLSLERGKDGWSVTETASYPQSSYCNCGP